MPMQPNMEPSDFINILMRKKWLVIFSFLIIFFIALVYNVVTPDVYKSTAKILITPPTVAEGVVKTDIQTSVTDRVKALRLDTFTTTSLKKLIQAIGVETLGFEGMSEAKMLGKMASRISFEFDIKEDYYRASSGVHVFAVSFLHENPDVAQKVVATLSSNFIEQNKKSRIIIVDDTTKFLNEQLETTRKRLEIQEYKLKQYKEKHGGELPQQLEIMMNQLARLQEQLRSNNEAISRLENRKLILESQASTLRRNVAETVVLPADPRLDAKRKQVAELKQKFTEKHPAVVQAEWELTQLEAQAQTRGATNQAAANTQPASPEKIELNRIMEQITQVDLEITSTKRDNVSTQALMNSIQYKLDKMPQREQELISLNRDYDNLKKWYDETLDKTLKASTSKNLEEIQKGERFQEIESASLPLRSRPAAPNRLTSFLLALAASMGIGVGGAFALEILDPRLRAAKEFKSFFSVPVLATLPTIQDEAYMRRVSFRSKAVITSLISITGVYVIFVAMNVPKIKLILRSIIISVGG